jgi:hypothetical protein
VTRGRGLSRRGRGPGQTGEHHGEDRRQEKRCEERRGL